MHPEHTTEAQSSQLDTLSRIELAVLGQQYADHLLERNSWLVDEQNADPEPVKWDPTGIDIIPLRRPQRQIADLGTT